ncbi:MAG: sulfite exporter TauE/SafE family protein [Burkholderiales bacterium]
MLSAEHTLPSSLLLMAGAVFLLGGLVKGVIGLGLPTIVMGLLSLSMPPAQAAALLVVPSLLTNVWQIAARPGWLSMTKRLFPMLLGLCAGIALGSGWLTRAPAAWATAGLGLALVVYSLLGLGAVHWVLSPAASRIWAVPVGLCTGLVTAATGVFVIPAVPYLQALGLDKEELVQALGLSFLVSTIALGLSLSHGGALNLEMGLASLLALVPAIAGMAIGQGLRQRLSPAAFKRVFLWGLLTLGVYLCSRSLVSTF